MMAASEHKTNLKNLQEKTRLGLLKKQQLSNNSGDSTVGWEGHVEMLQDLIQIAAEEGEWEFAYDFKENVSQEMLAKVGTEFKTRYGDVMVIVNYGQNRIEVSWHPSNEV
jgi:hypothetical protein